jgi:hypothetical protein
MATLPDLSTFDHWAGETGGATLTLPIRGKSYTWRAGDLSLWAMLTLRRLDEKAREIADKVARDEPVDDLEIALTDAEQKRLDLDLLGDQLDRMTEDGVRWPEALHVSATLLTWHLRGHRAAVDAWARKNEERPADPPAPAASTTTAGSSTRKKTPARARSGGATSSRSGTSSKQTSTASTTSTSPRKPSAARGQRAGS